MSQKFIQSSLSPAGLTSVLKTLNQDGVAYHFVSTGTDAHPKLELRSDVAGVPDISINLWDDGTFSTLLNTPLMQASLPNV